MGRPSDYTPAIADAICGRLSDGESLRAICRSDDMPHRVTVFRWLAGDESFRSQYARARECQADAMFDDIRDIADAPAHDAVDVQRARLMVDARKWMAGKLRPKVYGDKIDVEHAGTVTVQRVERAIVDPQHPDS